MKITIDMVLVENPCKTYTREYMEKLACGRESLTPDEVAGLKISIEDRLWILGRLVGRHDPTRIVARRIVRDALGHREIPIAYRDWLDSGDENLRPAARDAARAAARAAAWDAAWYAAWAATWTAARPAAWDAARAVAADIYMSWMVDFLESIESEES